MNYSFCHYENDEMKMYVMTCEPRLVCFAMLYRHLLIRAGTKKRELSVLVARPTIGGFSHCLLELDGNAEAHA